MADPVSNLVIRINNAEIVKQLDKMNKDFKKSFTEINSGLELLKKGYNVVFGAIGTVTGAIRDVTQAAIEEERAERKLTVSLRNRGVAAKTVTRELKNQNRELERKVGIDRLNLLQIESTLAALGVQTRDLNDATKATIGLADVTGQSLLEATKVVAKGFTGQIGALREYNIIASDVSDAQNKLVELFNITESRGGTLEGKLGRLSASFNGLKRALGGLVTGAAEGKGGAFDQAASGIDAIADAITRNQSNIERGSRLIAESLIKVALSSALTSRGGRALAGALKTAGGARGLSAAARTALDALGAPEDVVGVGAPSLVAPKPRVKRPLTPEEKEAAQKLEDDVNAGIAEFTVGRALSPEARQRQVQVLVDALRDEGRLEPSPLAAPALGAGPAIGGPRQIGLSGPAGFGFAATGPLSDEAAMADREAIEDQKLNNQLLKASFEERFKIVKDSNDTLTDEQARIISISKSGQLELQNAVAGTLATGVEAAASGKNVLQATGQFFGGFVVQLGKSLIQMGSAALAFEALSLIPIFRPATGAPGLSATGGAIALATGAALVAAGTAIKGATSGEPSVEGRLRLNQLLAKADAARKGDSDKDSDRDRRRARGTDRFEGFSTGPSNITNVYNINFGGRGFVVGSPARVGQEIRRILEQADRLGGRNIRRAGP